MLSSVLLVSMEIRLNTSQLVEARRDQLFKCIETLNTPHKLITITYLKAFNSSPYDLDLDSDFII